MAVTYKVVRSSEPSPLSVKGNAKDNTLSGNHSLIYDVEVSDPDDDEFSPMDISEADVFINAPCPVVNRSIYFFGGKIVPYFICRSKTVKRNPKIRSRFRVECGFEFDGQSGQTPQAPPTSLTDIAAKVESTIEEVPIVIYKDLASPSRVYLTPNRNFYSEPLITRKPVLTLRITQYEAAMTFEQQLARSLVCNESEYRTKDRYMWITDPVVVANAQVVLADSTINAVQATYTLRLSPFPWGWKESRVLNDTHYRESAGGEPVPFIDQKSGAFKTGFVKLDGTIKAGDIPDYDYFEGQDTIDYTTFLSV